MPSIDWQIAAFLKTNLNAPAPAASDSVSWAFFRGRDRITTSPSPLWGNFSLSLIERLWWSRPGFHGPSSSLLLTHPRYVLGPLPLVPPWHLWAFSWKTRTHCQSCSCLNPFTSSLRTSVSKLFTEHQDHISYRSNSTKMIFIFKNTIIEKIEVWSFYEPCVSHKKQNLHN